MACVSIMSKEAFVRGVFWYGAVVGGAAAYKLVVEESDDWTTRAQVVIAGGALGCVLFPAPQLASITYAAAILVPRLVMRGLEYVTERQWHHILADGVVAALLGWPAVLRLADIAGEVGLGGKMGRPP
jgi:hypothetical protein